MELWAKFWAVLLFGGLGLFVCMAVSVAIGGVFDIIALFKNLKARLKESRESSGERDG